MKQKYQTSKNLFLKIAKNLKTKIYSKHIYLRQQPEN